MLLKVISKSDSWHYCLCIKVYHRLKEKLMSLKKRNVGSDEEEDKAAMEESVNNSTPPGSAYVELLQTISPQALPGDEFMLFSVFRKS